MLRDKNNIEMIYVCNVSVRNYKIFFQNQSGIYQKGQLWRLQILTSSWVLRVTRHSQYDVMMIQNTHKLSYTGNYKNKWFVIAYILILWMSLRRGILPGLLSLLIIGPLTNPDAVLFAVDFGLSEGATLLPQFSG